MTQTSTVKYQHYRAKLDPQVTYSRFKFGKFTFKNHFSIIAINQEMYDRIAQTIISMLGISSPYQGTILKALRQTIQLLENFSGATLLLEFSTLWKDMLIRCKLNLSDVNLGYLMSLSEVELEAEVDVEAVFDIPVSVLKYYFLEIIGLGELGVVEGNYTTWTRIGTVAIPMSLGNYSRVGVHVDEVNSLIKIGFTPSSNKTNFWILDLKNLTPYFISDPAYTYYADYGSESMTIGMKLASLILPPVFSLNKYVGVRRSGMEIVEVWSGKNLVWSINVTLIVATYQAVGLYMSLSGKYLIVYMRNTSGNTFELLIYEGS